MTARARVSWVLGFCAVALVLAAGSAAAQDTPGADPPPQPSGEAGEPWIVEGDRLEGTREAGTDIERPRIRHGVLRIQALHGRLTADRNMLTLIDEVRIADTSRVVTSEQGVYRRNLRILDLAGDVRGTGPEGTFEAGNLTWNRRIGELVLRDEPRLLEPTRIVEADRIVQQTEARTGDAIGNVRILVLPDTAWAFGRRARYDNTTGRTLLTGEPSLVTPATPNEPETVVFADSLFLDENERTGTAIGSVRIRRGDLRTRSARAVFRWDEEQIRLYGDPVAWDRDGVIEADTMIVRISGRQADQLRAFGDVRVRYSPRDKTGEDNLVWGDTLTARLRRGAVTDMVVEGSAASLYLPSIADAATGAGRNLSRGRRIHVFFSRGEAERVDLIGSAEGTYVYPSDRNQRRLRDPSARDSILSAAPGVIVPGAVSDTVGAGLPAPPDTARAAPMDAGAGPDTAGVETSDDAGGATVSPADTLAPVRPLPSIAPRRHPEIPDRLRPGGRARAAGPAAAPEDPPPLPPRLAAFLQRGELELPDSLLTPYDRLFDERVEYSGDTIRFFVPEDRIRITGNGALEYRGNTLASREIEYFAERELVTALGEPEISDPEATIRGVKMTYRTDEREGIVYRGRTEFEGGFYFGEEIKKLAADELLVRSGDYTTCEKDSAPDYHFHAERMKVILKDKVVARPVVLYLRNIPVFALPFYIFPVKGGRQSGVTMPDFELGVGDRGRFVRNFGYYWAISDYMDARSWVDYYDRGPRIYLNGLYRYKIRYKLDGSFEGNYLRETTSTGGRDLRWSLRGGHTQQLGERSQLTARLDFTTDQSFRGDQDFGAGVDERLNRILKSSAQYRRSWSGAGLTAVASRTEYLDETTANGVQVTQSIPQIDFSVNSRPLGVTPDMYGQGGRLPFLASTYLSTNFRYRNVYTRRFDDTISANQAFQQNASLSDTRSLGPYLRLQPSLSASWAIFGRNNLDEAWRAGASWSGSVSAGSTIYGNFLFPVGPLEGLRHIIEPSASWSYAPELRSLTYADTSGVRRSRFPNVGGIGLSGSKRSAMAFSLSQRFHLKYRRGEEVVKKENVLTISSATSYDFLAEDTRKPLSTIRNTISFRPFQTFDSGATLEHDPYTWERLSMSVNTTLSISDRLFAPGAADTVGGPGLDYGEFGETELQGSADAGRAPSGVIGTSIPWSLSLSHAYSTRQGASRPSQSLNARLSLNPTLKWRVAGSVYANLQEKEVVSHTLSLYRDLHCWELSFEQRTSGSRSEYYFRISIKQIPDVQYQRESR